MNEPAREDVSGWLKRSWDAASDDDLVTAQISLEIAKEQFRVLRAREWKALSEEDRTRIVAFTEAQGWRVDEETGEALPPLPNGR